MYPIAIQKPSGPPIDYSSLNKNYQPKDNIKVELFQNKVELLPPAPPLAINTDFRGQNKIPLPRVPLAFNYNYGFTGLSRSGPSSLNGAVPLMGTPLTKIGTENFKVLEPVNLFPALKFKC